MAANSTISLTSISFNLLFGLIQDTLINLSNRYVLWIIVIENAIEKRIPLCFDITFARFTDVRDA